MNNQSAPEFSSHEMTQIAEYVMPDIPSGRAEIGLLFGTRHGVEDFCQAAYFLWKRKMFLKLVITGGVTGTERLSEATVIAQRLMQMGVPEVDLILEHQAMNSGENVLFAKQLIAEMMPLKSIASVLVIGKICSMRRYLMTLERHWPEVARFACPINYFGVPKNQWFEHEEFRTRVLSEYAKIPQYVQQDFLRELKVNSVPLSFLVTPL
jgi:uncharacterized SAM-binding protein YcdF (DUF218 family)